ncbi:MAG: hypothetical protein IJW59_05835 [Clostridia bacterium]|nr:hypothetical protein [Clostridia bacterium]
MSILSGYPIGAKLTSDFYHQSKITKGQAQTISAFTSTSGPLFIIGTVGIGFFKSQKLGIIILISHFISAILNGFLYKQKNKTTILLHKNTSIQNPLGESMTSSITSIMVVGGFIAIFYMLLQTLLQLNILTPITNLFELVGIQKQVSTSIISGLIEVTTGTAMLSQCNLSFDIVAIITSFLISFGGLSIHAQAYCFLRNFDMPYAKFLLQKITHALISASVTFIILLIF